MAEWMDLIAEFDEQDGAARTRFRSTAEWLAWECDLSGRTARDYVRVARRLRTMPLVARAFGDGRLSYSQTRALTRTSPEEDEAALLRVALTSTTAQLERYVRSLRSAESADLDVANAAHTRRRLETFWGEDGLLRYFGALPADAGAAFVEAIDTAAAALIGAPAGDDCVAVLPTRTRGALRADALAEMALSGSPRTHLVLHADPASLACQATGDAPRVGEVCALDAGPAIPSEMARRLTCDAEVSLAGVNLGRTQRVINAPLRRALEARDGRVCAMPGCDRQHGLQGHHIKHWALDGRTDLENLVLVCRYHHRCFHEEGFTIARRHGALIIRGPDGQQLDELPSRASPGLAA